VTREISAGGVVVRQMGGEWRVAAIEPAGREEKSGKRALALPKGLVDTGEKPEETARREVREETGLEATLVAKLGDVKYMYVRKWAGGERVFKIVSFYLFRYRSGELGDISEEMGKEVKDALWLPLERAPKELSYKGEREMAAKALEYIRAHPL
jgi:8-oxo-dGTP pyrophosphatase MutT (NUDIX family)